MENGESIKCGILIAFPALTYVRFIKILTALIFLMYTILLNLVLNQ